MASNTYSDTIFNSLAQVSIAGVGGGVYEYVHHTTIEGQHDVVLRKCDGRYLVQYGKQIAYDLLYEQACVEYGACILHALACAGRMDQ